MKKFIAALAIATALGLVGCSLPVEGPAAPTAEGRAPDSSAAAEALEHPTVESSDPPPIIVQRPAPDAQQSEPVPTMSVDEVCSVWKQGFKVLNEGSVPPKEAMVTLEKVTAAAPPEIRVQSGIATRILWSQILHPSNQPASAETMGYLAALRQACYDLTGIDVVEGLDG
ncbi:hypothetical protein [Arthrobacter sp. ISL-69]|uniref:hypothetical protein n=1 Tax=Arthrobacter sp. ISL-69 TaxID=2819113 RepID=UPI001BEC5FC2|nr:hypothetical protein [Arthrobacter sp. ISL-69]MBT2538395.1 hypothetical protein [Arthrobacter sp. ISL-69]